MAKFLKTLDNVTTANVEEFLVKMGVSVQHSQIQEIKAHLDLLDKNSRDSNPASQASVKSEPDMDTAPPTPKIARKVSFTLREKSKLTCI